MSFFYPGSGTRYHSLIAGVGLTIATTTVAALDGDIDNDGDVDLNDLNLILQDRNQPASGPDDPRDLDGDGVITVLDARRLVLLCINPRCVVIDPPPPDDEPPTANPDSYTTIGNTSLLAGGGTWPTPAITNEFNVLENDDPGADSLPEDLSVVAFDGPTTAGGTVSINIDGSFVYDPPTGLADDTDTFTYTLMQQGDPVQSTTETVTITIDNMVWYVDDDADDGDGSATDPFPNLDLAEEASSVNHTIFVYEGSYNGDGIDLLNNQLLIGEGNGLEMLNQILVAPGARPVIDGNTNNGIDLGSDNTIRGLDIDSTGNGGGIVGNGVGNLIISEVSVNTQNGPGVDLRNGNTLDVTFDNLDINNDTGDGIVLDSVGGSTTIGGLTVSTIGGDGLRANNAGSLSIDGTDNGIHADSGIGINITDSTINGNMTFREISASGGDSGIILNTTGSSGSFTVTGDSDIPGTGGDIQNTSGDGINLNNSPNVSINNMSISSTGGDAIKVFTDELNDPPPSFTFSSVDINTPGDDGIDLNTRGSGMVLLDGGSIENYSGTAIKILNNAPTPDDPLNVEISNSTLLGVPFVGRAGEIAARDNGNINALIRDVDTNFGFGSTIEAAGGPGDDPLIRALIVDNVIFVEDPAFAVLAGDTSPGGSGQVEISLQNNVLSAFNPTTPAFTFDAVGDGDGCLDAINNQFFANPGNPGVSLFQFDDAELGISQPNIPGFQSDNFSTDVAIGGDILFNEICNPLP